MSFEQRTELSGAELDAFLGTHETGVVSFAREDEPYAIPVSYGYDALGRRFYLRLVSTPRSRKHSFLESAPRARFVVYEEEGDVYRSVVASGTLREVTRDELTVEHVEQYGDAKRPLFETWDESKRDLEIRLYLLDPEELNGRKVEVDREQE